MSYSSAGSMERERAMPRLVEFWPKEGSQESTRGKKGQEMRQTHTQLPLPSRPRSSVLGNHATQCLPLTANAHAVDVEKALLPPIRCGSNSDVSTLDSSSATFGPALLQLKTVRHAKSTRSRSLRTVRYIRFTLFTVYRRLFTLVVLLNLFTLYPLLQRRPHGIHAVLDPSLFALFTSINLCIATLVRSDLLIGILFRAAWLVPWHVPLRVRLCLARLYCYGGIHAGAAVAGTAWWFVFTGALCWQYVNESSVSGLNLAIAFATLSLLFTIIFFASEPIRTQYHNTFEITHRKLGWLVLVLFWIQLLLLTSGRITTSPTLYFLALTTIRTIYPWLLIRRWTFTAHPLSRNALRLSFPNRIGKFNIVSISSAPLREWHPFATFPFPANGDPDEGTSLIMSAAGDWTRNVLASVATQQRLHHIHTESHTTASTTNIKKSREQQLKLTFWVKPHPKPSVLSLSLLFPRILVLTTGSGIGPCLSSLLHRPQNSTSQIARLVWSTRSPMRTYGPAILALVHRADPDAIVVDTDKTGRPDLVTLAARVSREISAEAVFVVSNRLVTGMVVGGLEKRGVRAFGPIWDS